MATTTTATQPLPQFAPYQNDYWARAQDVANIGYRQAPGTYVGPNETLQSGWEAIQNRAINGNAAMSDAQQGLQNFYGQQQQGATRNPYGQVQAGSNNDTIGTSRSGFVGAGSNNDTIGTSRSGFVGAGNNSMQVSGGGNPYANHNNPYLNQQIDAAQGDVIRNWNNVQRPSWDTQMASSGSFGNANVQQAAQNAQSDMQQNLGRISGDMRMGAYNQAAGLTEAGLNRNLGAQQFNVGTNTDNINRQFGAGQFNAGLDEAYRGRSLGAQQFNSGLQDRNLDRNYTAQTFNAGLDEAYRGRSLGAQQFNSGLQDRNLDRNYNAQTFNAGQGQEWAGRNDAMYGGNQNRMLQAYGMAPSFAANDYLDANALLGVGGQQQGFDQARQNQRNDWWNQSRNYAGQQLDAYGRRLGMMQPGQQTTQTAPGPSTVSQVVGGAVTGAGLANWWGQS